MKDEQTLTPALPDGEAVAWREALDDLKTHREAWRQALEDLAKNGTDTSVREDEEGYWQHELKAFDRTFAALASPPPVSGEVREALDESCRSIESAIRLLQQDINTPRINFTAQDLIDGLTRAAAVARIALSAHGSET